MTTTAGCAPEPEGRYRKACAVSSPLGKVTGLWAWMAMLGRTRLSRRNRAGARTLLFMGLLGTNHTCIAEELVRGQVPYLPTSAKSPTSAHIRNREFAIAPKVTGSSGVASCTSQHRFRGLEKQRRPTPPRAGAATRLSASRPVAATCRDG